MGESEITSVQRREPPLVYATSPAANATPAAVTAVPAVKIVSTCTLVLEEPRKLGGGGPSNSSIREIGSLDGT